MTVWGNETESVEERARRWSTEISGNDYSEILRHLDYMARKVFNEYEPCRRPGPDFWDRCRDWLNGADEEEDQKLLLGLLSHLHFVTRAEYEALSRAAYRVSVIPWLVRLLDLSLEDPATEERLTREVAATWFCPISDSMQIGTFFHLNRIAGADLRPDFRSLARLGSKERIQAYMKQRGLQRIVLLEDFVGTGGQMKEAVEFAAQLAPTLLVPLIVCPEGEGLALRLASNHQNLSYRAVVRLPEHTLIPKQAGETDSDFQRHTSALVRRLESVVKGTDATPADKWHGSFGFRDTGALVVLYSNCPDNTLPVIHRQSNTWKPLFPRATRV